ncbi:MAG: hypothetical protein M1829_002690 [Trizodia sp. TS-e1964]|nr:MAG: hypothetical protein M1829_002690 [Trizodia sp. TS-e1964]
MLGSSLPSTMLEGRPVAAAAAADVDAAAAAAAVDVNAAHTLYASAQISLHVFRINAPADVGLRRCTRDAEESRVQLVLRERDLFAAFVRDVGAGAGAEGELEHWGPDSAGESGELGSGAREAGFGALE